MSQKTSNLTYPNDILVCRVSERYRLFGKVASTWQLCLVSRILLCAICLAPMLLHGQSRKELEEKRLRLIEEINQTNRKLQETQQSKTATLNSYLALKKQVAQRRQLVATLRQEIDEADSLIAQSAAEMHMLESDITHLRAEYARTLRTAWRLHLQQTWATWLFSSNSFNQALQRRRFMKQYEQNRRRQAQLILETQQLLATKVAMLEKTKAEQQQLMAQALQQSELLRTALQDKDRALKSLQADESRLLKELERTEKERERFNAAIESLIVAEMNQKRKESRMPPPPKPGDSPRPEETPAPDKSGFGARRGSLPWPVSGGRISRAFGPQPHPTLKDVIVPNNGVDIQAASGTDVSAVFDGKVVSVQFIPGHLNMVLIQHGTYYTVYSNLDVLAVNRNDTVKAGQVIGKLGKNDLHFEVWREKNRLNPAHWLQ